MRAQRSGLVVMVGAAEAAGPAVRLVQEARRAAALDTLAAAGAIGLFDRLIVVTNDSAWATESQSDWLVDLDDTRHPFHFGRRLAGVIDYYGLTHVTYVGAGAAPLYGPAELARIAQTVLASDRALVTNNLHSADWAAFTPAGAMAEHSERVLRDNALAWVLHREAGLPADVWPPTAANRLDIDTPTDLLVLAGHPDCSPRLQATLADMRLDTGRLEQALGVLATEGTHVIVGGRVASSTWAALERKTLCWVRLFAEERGMIASGRQSRGEARSLLGAYLDQVGMERFLQTLEEWADAVFLDSRVLLAHRHLWPSAEDRFAADLGWVERIEEPFLRQLTEGALTASIPIIFGGHSLVSGGLLALLDRVGARQAGAKGRE